MRDFIYDLRRTLTGKFTIIMIILIILATSSIVYGTVRSFNSSTGPSPGSEAFVLPNVYYRNGGFNISDFVVNGYGHPVSGLKISSSAVNVSNRIGVPDHIVYFNGTTDSSGYVNFSSSMNWTNIRYTYSPQYVDGINVSFSVATLDQYGFFSGSPLDNNFGQGNGFSSFYMFSISNASSVSTKNIFLYYISPNGSAMPQEKIYYEVHINGYSLPTSNNTGMTYFKTIGGTRSLIFSLPLNETANGNPVVVELFNTSSSRPIAGMASVLYTHTSAGSILDSAVVFPYEFLIPILGIFSAYFYYGKDKASGVLESIIARPVTKGRIFMSRFTAGSLSFLFAILVAVAISDIIIFRFTGSWIGTDSFFSVVLGYTAEAVAFSGILYLVAQYVKSEGGILGTGIGLFFLLVLFWGLIVDVILFELHVNTALKSYIVLNLSLSAISPASIPTLSSALNSGVFQAPSGSALLASSVGITLFSVVAVGVIWVIVPFIFSYLLARSRD